MDKEYEFFIPGRLPNLNDFIAAYCKNRHMGSEMKKEAEQYICICIKNKLKGLEIKEPVYMEYLWVEENRNRDKDNIAFAKKFIQDALVTCRVLKNDGWKEITGFRDNFEVDKGHSGVEVKIITSEVEK